VLLDVSRLRIGELEAPGQTQARAAFAQRDDGGQVRFDEKPLVAASAAVVQPIDVQLLLVQQQPWRQQWAEQGAELAKTLQRLFEVAGVGQRQADITVVPGQQALSEQKAAVRSAQQAFGVADERQQLLRADAGAAAGDVLVEQPTA